MSTILAKKISFAYTLSIMNNIEQKYAEFILNEELRIEGGEKLTINANEETIAFAHLLAHMAAEKTGVNVQIVFIDHGKVESVDEIEPDFQEKASGKVCMLHLASFPSFSPLNDDNKELSAKELGEYRVISEPVIAGRRIAVPWAICYVPTPAWAEFVFGPGATTDSLWLLLSDILKLDSEDNSLRMQHQILKNRCAKLNNANITQLILKSNSCDLKLDINQELHLATTSTMLSSGRLFYPTAPCEEVIIPISKHSGSGKFITTYPFRLFDRVFSSAEVSIENGKVVSFKVEDGTTHITKYLSIDEESKCLSELILCDGYTPSSKLEVSTGIPMLDRMRTTSLVLGGITPDTLQAESDEDIDKTIINNSFVRLELPLGSKDLSIQGITEFGEIIDIMEDGIILF